MLSYDVINGSYDPQMSLIKTLLYTVDCNRRIFEQEHEGTRKGKTHCSDNQDGLKN